MSRADLAVAALETSVLDARVIRPAVLKDVPRLVAMGEQFIESTGYRDLVAVNPAQMAIVATQLIESPSGVVLVVEQRRVVVGMIGLMLYAHHFSGELTVGEVFWWVDPAARGDGVRLLVQAERWAMEQGAVSIQMIAPTQQVGQVYRRFGYAPIETTFSKRLAP